MTEIKETVKSEEFVVHIPFKRNDEDSVRVTVLQMKKPTFCDSCGAKFDHQPEKCSGCGKSDRLRTMT